MRATAGFSGRGERGAAAGAYTTRWYTSPCVFPIGETWPPAMAKKTIARIVGLLDLVRREYPDLEDPEDAVRAGAVTVDGVAVRNLASRVRRGAVIRVDRPKTLRGARKLTAALDGFDVSVAGRVGLDLGASTGGFTSVLLERDARLVYAVDVGYGQLLGSLRQDPRVRNLERTNLADLNRELVDVPVDVVTVDLSYLSIAKAVGQVEGVEFAAGADLIALVKPMFELGAGALPSDEAELREAVRLAAAGVEQQRWSVQGVIDSPARGGHGAIEFLLHATRTERGPVA
jgi:23S rRNA (cytidine1920-2'-O)/16S rRNA (cytidine1409-2'-O)-methyltransferase